MSKHTPGPWYARPLVLQVVDKKIWFDDAGARHGDTPNMVIDCNSVADTHLIAAAPELLAALECLLEYATHETAEEYEAIETALAAVKSAKGGAA